MMQRKHGFNLVEILLALGVIMIGVVSLMGLFPVAAKVTSDATMETYGANAIEDFANYIRQQVTEEDSDGKTKWNDWITASSPLIPKTQPDSMLGKKEDSYEDEILTASNWKATEGNNKRLFKHKTNDGVYLLVSVRGMDADDDIDLDQDAEKIDQRVLITVWQSKIKRVLKGTTATEYSRKYGVRLNFKVDWPAERPDVRYNEDTSELVKMRESRLFAMDLVNPNPEESED